MIKGNESDVGNIDFELQAKRSDKFLCLTYNIVQELIRTIHISATRDWVWIKMYSILNGQVVYIEKKIKIEYCQHVTHSPWLCHILLYL